MRPPVFLALLLLFTGNVLIDALQQRASSAVQPLKPQPIQQSLLTRSCLTTMLSQDKVTDYCLLSWRRQTSILVEHADGL